MPKLNHLAKKAARSGYSRLPWYGKLLLPVALVGALVWIVADLVATYLI